MRCMPQFQDREDGEALCPQPGSAGTESSPIPALFSSWLPAVSQDLSSTGTRDRELLHSLGKQTEESARGAAAYQLQGITSSENCQAGL